MVASVVLAAVVLVGAALAAVAPSALVPGTTHRDIALAAALDVRSSAVGVSEPYLSYGLGDADGDMAAIAAMGAGDVRVQVYWPATEPERGVYDWRSLDDIVAAAERHGLGVMGVVSHTPAWAGPSTAAMPDPAVYAAFLGAVAERYRGRIGAYEVWNEPNASLFLSPPDPAAYTSLLRAALPAVRAADPAAVVLGGALITASNTAGNVDPVSFVRGMYAAGAAGTFDALSFHPYAYPLGTDFAAGAGFPNSAFEQLRSVREAMVAAGDGGKRIWATEFGVPTVGGITEADQTRVVVDFLRTWRTYDFAGPAYLHTTRDLRVGSGDPEDNFGLYDTTGRPKEVVGAVAALIAGG